MYCNNVHDFVHDMNATGLPDVLSHTLDKGYGTRNMAYLCQSNKRVQGIPACTHTSHERFVLSM